MYNVTIVNEVIHWMKGKRKGIHRIAALKLDIPEAFDKMGWEYLEAIMTAFRPCHR